MKASLPDAATILIIDDSQEVSQATARTLKKVGYTVFEAKSGDAGLARAAEVQPDLILVDVVMPDMDGFEVCRRFQSIPGMDDPAVVLVSSYKVSSADQARGLETGVSEYIARPMPNRELLARVQRVLAEKKVRDAVREDRNQLERELQQAQRLESVGRLASGVAHDFNNLLSVILGYSSLLGDRETTQDDYREALTQIRDAAEKAKSLTRQLLAFSRSHALQIEVVDLNEITEGFKNLFERLVGEQIRVHLLLADEPLLVRADAAQLEQVLMNVAVNAKDAMPGGGDLTIKTRIEPGERERQQLGANAARETHAVLSIADTGCGMSPDILTTVFEPFFTTKQEGEGTGLGLSTTRGIIVQLGGSVRVRSEEGQGTEFTILLPLTDERPAATPTPVTPEIEAVASSRILVIEDDDSLRTVIHRILAQAGYDVASFQNGEKAVHTACAMNEDVTLALVDLILPGMNGRDTIANIRLSHPKVRPLFMSGYSSDVVSRYALGAEDLEFIQKPFSADQLLEKVAKVIQS